jgi:Phage related hypothetical protein (DUF1799)
LLLGLLDRVRGQSKKLAQVARIQACGQLYIPNQGEDPDDTTEIDEAAAIFGLQIVTGSDDDVGDGGDNTPKQDLCYLWPENVDTFNLWCQLQTQWRIGMSGATGLDYTAVTAYLRDIAGIKKKDLPERFAEIRAMEVATLNEWAAQQAKQ